MLGPVSSYDAAARRLAGVLAAAAGQPLDVVVFDQPSSSTSPTPLLASLPRTGRLDGLLLVSQPLDAAVVARLAELGLPAVLLDQHHPGLSSVRSDDAAGGRLAAAHLLERDHRRIAVLAEAQRTAAYVSPAQHRLAGFRAALPGLRAAVGTCAHDLAAATAAARDLLAHRPTAVFAPADLLAAGVPAAARGLGLAVPGDVAVLGYDDGDLAAALELSTVRQPLRESGALAP